MFGNLNNNATANEERVSAGHQVWETALYPVIIKMAYGLQSEKGALGVSIEFEREDGSTFRENIYVTNTKGENTYKDKDTKEAVYLPGFKRINDICLITTGKKLSDMVPEDRVLSVYDPESKGMINKPMPVLLELLTQKVIIGVRKITAFKQERVGGDWVDTDTVRTYNELDFVFHPEQKITVAEAEQGVSEPTLYVKWDESFTGKDFDKTKGKARGGNKPTPKATGSTFGSQAPAKSLFGNK